MTNDITLTPEGGGTVASCQRCGWLTWTINRVRGLEAAQAHAKRCRARNPH